MCFFKMKTPAAPAAPPPPPAPPATEPSKAAQEIELQSKNRSRARAMRLAGLQATNITGGTLGQSMASTSQKTLLGQ